MKANGVQLKWQKTQLEVEDRFLAALQTAADETTENDAASTAQFKAILNIASDLTHEMNNKRFKGDSHSLIIQSCCFSWASLSRVLQLIGGLDGNNLFSLSIQQLLHLIAWSGEYRHISENLYPKLFLHSKKPNLADLPSLLFLDKQGGPVCKADIHIISEDDIDIDIDGGVVSQGIVFHAFCWVSVAIWEVHRLAQDELLIRSRQEADLWLNQVYSKPHEMHQTNSGALVTNLCEDVFSLAALHLKTLREQLMDANATNESNIMVVCIVLNRLRHAHIKINGNGNANANINARIWNYQKKDALEICCATANDYYRMSQRVEDLQNDVLSEAKLSQALRGVLQEACDELVNTYVTDSICAVSMASKWVMEPIEDNLSQQLFRREWEEVLTHNELALALTRTLVSIMQIKEMVACFVLLCFVYKAHTLILKICDAVDIVLTRQLTHHEYNI